MDTLARKLERSSRVKENIAFFSLKSNSLQYCESRLESFASLLRELDSNIIEYVNQPTSIFYKRKNRLLRYTPDSLVRYSNREVVFEEVKPFSRTLDAAFIEKFQFLQNHFDNELGIPLILNTALSENHNVSRCNYELLYANLKRARRNDSSSIYKMILIGLPKKLTLSDLMKRCVQLSQSVNLAFEMIAVGIYAFSNATLFDINTVLELRHG
jgi:hypothetical protein